jgi:hypothetical protein
MGKSGVVLDSSGSHHSGQLACPAHMQPLYLPPYSPERESCRANLSPHAQETFQYHLHDAGNLAKCLDRRTAAVLGTSDGVTQAHRRSVVGRSSRKEYIISLLKEYKACLERTGLVLSHEAGISFDLTTDETSWSLDFLSVYRQTLITMQRKTDPHIEHIAVARNDD